MMKKLIELHDSRISKVTAVEGNLTIDFDPLVVLHVTDEFGHEFEKTEYLKGTIKIYNFRGEPPSTGILFDGYFQMEECRYPLMTNLE